MRFGEESYAGFWRRAAALILDLLLLVLALTAVGGAVIALRGMRLPLGTDEVFVLVLVLIPVLLAFAVYDVEMTHRRGATLGKRALGATVRDLDGGLPSRGVCIARLLAWIYAALPAGLGLYWAAWDRRKQGWHDRLVGTVVLRPGGADIATPSPREPSPLSFAEEPSAPEDPASRLPPGAEPAWAAAPTPAPPQAMPPPSPPPAAPAAPPAAPEAWTAPATAASSPAPVVPDPSVLSAPQPPVAPPVDPNLQAIARANLEADAADWLHQVAGQVDARLDRVSPTWRKSSHAEVARACTFGLLIAHLARMYPHMRPELGRVAEAHPSFGTLVEGGRLATLEEIVSEPMRITAWLGPLLDIGDPERLKTLTL